MSPRLLLSCVLLLASRGAAEFSGARMLGLRRSLESFADQLDAATPEAQEDLTAYSLILRARTAQLRGAAGNDATAAGVLDRLDAFYTVLPQRAYAREYAGPLAATAAEELRWAAARSATPEELLERLDADLELPADPEKTFSEGIPLTAWRKMSVVKKFLYKHRLSRPKHYVVVTPEQIIANVLPVEVGVETSGLVTHEETSREDKDYCFVLGGIEMEITPEWRLAHPRMHLPVPGQRVRVRGWSYYDDFHENDRDSPGKEKTVWEIHPVNDVEVLRP